MQNEILKKRYQEKCRMHSESGWNPKLRSILCMKYEKLYIEQSFATSVNTSF